MFSEFSRADWCRLGAGLLAAALLVAFAEPIGSALGTTRSVPLLFAGIIVFGLLTGIIELAARNSLSRRTKFVAKRAVAIVLLLIGGFYFIARKELADALGLQVSGLDSAVVLVGVIVILRLAHLTREAPGRASDE